MKAAGVLGTEPAQGSGDTLVDTAYYTGHTRKDCSPWAWAFGNTRDTLDRWGTGVPGPVAGELNRESAMELVQWSQCLLEPEPEPELEPQLELKQESDLLAAQEVEAGLGAGA